MPRQMNRIQFRLRHIFIATAIVAVLVNLVITIENPSVYAPLIAACGILFLFFWLIYFTSWLILRWGNRL
jgi:hypothetical protein